MQLVLDALRKKYGADHPKAVIEAYRHGRRSIRVRVVDPDLGGVHVTKRIDPLWEILKEHVPDEVREDIDVLLPITPKEAKTSAMSMEFDNPTPNGMP
ncbi:MAG: hypothetical protein HY040_28625 [Planctomycetes bacterium]|nr:hypothetical protein [Planctomycetota bacterium]